MGEGSLYRGDRGQRADTQAPCLRSLDAVESLDPLQVDQERGGDDALLHPHQEVRSPGQRNGAGPFPGKDLDRLAQGLRFTVFKRLQSFHGSFPSSGVCKKRAYHIAKRKVFVNDKICRQNRRRGRTWQSFPRCAIRFAGLVAGRGASPGNVMSPGVIRCPAITGSRPVADAIRDSPGRLDAGPGSVRGQSDI